MINIPVKSKINQIKVPMTKKITLINLWERKNKFD